MPLPEVLHGESWTKITAITVLPLIIWCAKNGRTITYGHLDREIVKRGWGHHVMAVQYGYPAGTIGDALIELEKKWGEPIPPLNALIVNQATGLPGKGVNYYLQRYYEPDEDVDEMTLDERKAIVEEIHSDIFSYEAWDKVLEEFEMEELQNGLEVGQQDDTVSLPGREGWSNEGESEEHKKLKNYIAKHPESIGLSEEFGEGIKEYLFASSDRADIVFQNNTKFIAVEVKSVISNESDLNRGIFQCIKYQALLRAEQISQNIPPTSKSILVTEEILPLDLQNLADRLNIKIVVHRVN